MYRFEALLVIIFKINCLFPCANTSPIPLINQEVIEVSHHKNSRPLSRTWEVALCAYPSTLSPMPSAIDLSGISLSAEGRTHHGSCRMRALTKREKKKIGCGCGHQPANPVERTRISSFTILCTFLAFWKWTGGGRASKTAAVVTSKVMTCPRVARHTSPRSARHLVWGAWSASVVGSVVPECYCPIDTHSTSTTAKPDQSSGGVNNIIPIITGPTYCPTIPSQVE